MQGDLAQKAESVSAQLAAIFPDSRPADAVVSAPVAGKSEPPRRHGAGPIVGVALATGLVGVVAGALLTPNSTRAPTIASPAPTALPAAIPLARPDPGAASTPAADPATAATPPPPVRGAGEATLTRPHASGPRASGPLAPGASAGMKRCDAVARGDRAWCAHGVVMAQDRALRRAYSRAVRAGVPRGVLASYTRRWAGLRRQAVTQPGRVAAGYATMSRDLTRMSQTRASARGRR